MTESAAQIAAGILIFLNIEIIGPRPNLLQIEAIMLADVQTTEVLLCAIPTNSETNFPIRHS